MKAKQAETASCSISRIALTSFIFFFVILFCLFTSLCEIQLQNIMNLSPTAFFANRCCPPLTTAESPPPSPPPEFRLFIGILTLPDQYWRRNMLRLVYGTQPPVSARVDIKFVFCNLNKEDQKVLVALEIMRYDDIIILNCTENMNSGKTYTYFSTLPDLLTDQTESERPYDYVMKADDDIYFRLGPLVESLRPLPREDLYYGFTIPCREMNPFKHYMSGMGYILSWDLVEWIGQSEIPKNHTEGPEDKVLGDWLEMGGRGKNRHNTKPAMYDYPVDVEKFKCSHNFTPETIAVHRLKNQEKWVKTLQYFNVTEQLKPSKLYHFS